MLFCYFCTPLAGKKPGEIRSESKYTKGELKDIVTVVKLYWNGLFNPPNEKTQFFGVLKCKHVTNLYTQI